MPSKQETQRWMVRLPKMWMRRWRTNMIEHKKETNRLIDWNNPQDRINYFRNLRKFLGEIESLCDFSEADWEREKCDDIDSRDLRAIFKRWNVYFIDHDDIPRVNLDEPGCEHNIVQSGVCVTCRANVSLQ